MTLQTNKVLLSCVWLFATPWTAALQAPLWNSSGRNTGVGCHALPSRGSSWPRDRTQVSCTAGRFFITWATREAQINISLTAKKEQNILTILVLAAWVSSRPTDLIMLRRSLVAFNLTFKFYFQIKFTTTKGRQFSTSPKKVLEKRL